MLFAKVSMPAFVLRADRIKSIIIRLAAGRKRTL